MLLTKASGYLALKNPYLFYNQEDVDNDDKILQEKEKPLPITGTFRLHALIQAYHQYGVGSRTAL
jgi:hypothetical protein